VISDNLDKNKAAIILLSTAANIISRHTSMVGVDRERPDKVTGEMIQRRVPMMHDPTLQSARHIRLAGVMCMSSASSSATQYMSMSSALSSAQSNYMPSFRGSSSATPNSSKVKMSPNGVIVNSVYFILFDTI